MARDMNAAYERMVSDMCFVANDDLIDPEDVMNEKKFQYLPLRARLIALGFVKHFTLDELNEKLEAYGCPRLYLRSFWEATLIFAIRGGLSYAEWKQMRAQCADIYATVENSSWFRDKRITYGELENYVLQNSDTEGDIIVTARQTQKLENAFERMPGTVEALRTFLVDNVCSFSAVREKSRYYFCKYLYYYLNARIEAYFDAVRRGSGVDEALSALMPLKVVTLLRRNQRLPEEEKRRYIQESALSCGEIFDEFNYFYFDYVSVDWVECLMECYRSVSEIPQKQRKSIANVFRRGRPELKQLSDEAVIDRCAQEMEAREDAAFSSEGNRGYGRNRSGEHAVHKYIQGTLDIDRTALICFLLFFGANTRLPEKQRLIPGRLREILIRCGYAPLDEADPFDRFVAGFLKESRPQLYLTEVMDEYAHREENSFLYHLYNNSVSYEADLLRVLSKSADAV